MAILAIESATDVCSVAIVDGSEKLFEHTIEAPRRHAELLAPLIKEALTDVDEQADAALSAVGVSAGPGSYTGLRIGVSSAKGVCFARGVPLVAVPTLHTLATACLETAGTVLCLLHARADEWYGGVLSRSDGAPDPSGQSAVVAGAGAEEIVASRVGTIDEWLSLLAESSGVRIPMCIATPPSCVARLEPHRETLASRAIEVVAVRPSALAVAQAAQRLAVAGHFADVDAFEPAYLRPFVARTAKGSIFDRLSF